MAHPSAAQVQDDFSRGYFCAVATLLRMEGGANTDVRDLFRCGGNPELADEEDKQLFREHGLMA
ncbi:hypothetical protein P245_19700 [Comamonas thiooxydans]|uniref:Uncharacterized protein n=1 Tax=Comamonas thiooxydans TaxID=363952 RepID=A0A0E3BBC6_9BURK|nr:hypothetical protein [Comamonas thiooxydans]KGG87678.1 hypothetical protein P245_19700 [Comamonas thiooxydans]